MESYATALLFAIPFFLILMLAEMAYGHYTQKQTYRLMDTIASLSSGLTNILKDSLGLAVILISYPWMVESLAITQIESTITIYVIAFICIDFASYWSHRLNHKINLFWNQHVIHHSSEEFNMACALRQSISNILGYGALFLIPAAVFGIPQKVIAFLAPIHLFGQFWYHTQHIGKLGWLEYLIVTPSQHRVHHAINPIYIDKNLSAIFCVWDRLFGTFQEELENVPPVFGVLKPVKTWNPFLINFIHFWNLLQDAWNSTSWVDKATLWFRPTGWRPKMVAIKHPHKIITNVYCLEKFKSPETIFLRKWAIFQLISTTIVLLVILYYFGSLSSFALSISGGILMAGIFSYTSVLDGWPWSWRLELIRSITSIMMVGWLWINFNSVIIVAMTIWLLPSIVLSMKEGMRKLNFVKNVQE